MGDEKNISVNGETLTLVIVGFGHDDLAGGGKAGITFGLKHLMKDTRQMNNSNTNSGGFTGSAMYSWLQNTLLKQLPSDLQAVLKSVNKKTSAGNQSSTINTNAMKLFLFSEIEIFARSATQNLARVRSTRTLQLRAIVSSTLPMAQGLRVGGGSVLLVPAPSTASAM